MWTDFSLCDVTGVIILYFNLGWNVTPVK